MEEEIKYIKSDNSSHLRLGVIEHINSLLISSNINKIVTVHGAYESLSLNDKIFIIGKLQEWLDDQKYIIKNELLNGE